MAIKKNFKGAVIRKPGPYSSLEQAQTGSSANASIGVLLIVGEADKGKPGSEEGIQAFSGSQLSQLFSKYGSGPIVDCAKAAGISPSKVNGIGSPDQILVWKTNSSTQASKLLKNGSSQDLIKISDPSWGAEGNQISVKVENGTDSSKQRIVTIKKGLITRVVSQNSAAPQITIEYTGGGSASVLTVGGSLTNKTLTVATTGGAPSDSFSLNLNDYTMKSLKEFIEAKGNFTISLGTAASAGFTPASDLDPVSSLDILTGPKTLYKLQKEIVDRINSEAADLVEAEIYALETGIPVAVGPVFLAGGAKGSSANSDFTDGLAKSLSNDWNVGLIAVSQDASDDISMGVTDASSSYDIASLQVALDTHLRLRGSIKNRKEAQGMIGQRSESVADAYAAAQGLNSELVQIAIQDVLVQDIAGNLVWKQPHVMAALMAGIRCGTDIGEPLTYKYINAAGIGHYVDPATGISGGDFNPSVDYDAAIDAGITFCEQKGGGFRVVVDNTTYGADQSFIFNRGSVMEAAQYVARTLRELVDQLFVGRKVSNGAADSIKRQLRMKLKELNRANITTASADAPEGYREDTFVVQQNGNTTLIQLEFIPVQGQDFFFFEYKVGDIIQSAV